MFNSLVVFSPTILLTEGNAKYCIANFGPDNRKKLCRGGKPNLGTAIFLRSLNSYPDHILNILNGMVLIFFNFIQKK